MWNTDLNLGLMLCLCNVKFTDDNTDAGFQNHDGKIEYYLIFVLKAANLAKPYSMDVYSINLARSEQLLWYNITQFFELCHIQQKVESINNNLTEYA